ncbi:MAG: nitrilase-related carbon-nitrogen hydrolase [Candidatus Caenarcaniphilales bacterium]|nr:nitrilase-related carbon-nitrogen hydrolase [Candidatus Caenarcaniphilales bacterium]
MPKLLISLIQFSSGEDKDNNLNKAESLVRKAVSESKDSGLNHLICLPEVFNFRSDDPDLNNRQAEKLNTGTTSFWAADLAKELNICLVAGSILEQNPISSKPFNTSMVFGPQGECLGIYRKINLFKLCSEDSSAPSLNEPQFRSPGRDIFHFTFAGWQIGLAICFDLRFPKIFQRYRQEGCELVLLPSAFTYKTGEAHWEILCRARAIENQIYIAAPNQTTAAKCWGNSLIVSPWGEVLQIMDSEGEGHISQILDVEFLNSVQQSLPMEF